jgi:lysophospholipase L1-like esterase
MELKESQTTTMTDGRLTVYNAGKNGEATRGALLRFDTDVAVHLPDICFIAFGMNDSMHENTPVLPEDYRRNLLQLAENCRKAGIHPVYVTVNPVNKEKLYERHDPPYFEAQGGPNALIEKYNGIIKEVAAAVGADVIDWHRRVMELSGTSVEPGSVLCSDGVHLSQDGLNTLARLIADWILDGKKTNSTIVAFGDSITKQGWIDIAAALCSDAG